MPENMSIASMVLAALEMEAPATRKCLERVPESLYTWKPHPKSMSMGSLVLIVAEIPKWITTMVEGTEIDFAKFEHFKATSAEEMVKHFDENMAAVKKVLQIASDTVMQEPFSLKNDGQLIMTSPKKDNILPSVNHWVHHRGQLTVYMRLNDIAVPSLYGPSADDGGF